MEPHNPTDAPVVTLHDWPDKPSFNEEELAQLTGVSTRQLQRLREEGLLPYSKPGRQVLYTRQDWQVCLRRTRRTGLASSAR